MTSVEEAIRHYQRRIDRSVENEAILLHCLDKLNKLPIIVKCLQDTRVGRTVNKLRNHDGEVGHAATALVAKWKTKVEDDIDDTGNVEPSTLNQLTESPEISFTPISGSVGYPSGNNSNKSSRSSDRSLEESGRLERKSGKKSDKKRSRPHHSSSSTSKSNVERENDSTVSSHRRGKNRRECNESNDKKRKCGCDLIDIDSAMGTSFAEALGMLDMPSSKHKKCVACSSIAETPVLLTKRPRLEPPLDIAVELLSPSTSTRAEAIALKCAFRQPSKQSGHIMTDEETIRYNITSRTVKTKVFCGNKAEPKCKVATLFEMCMRILQDNIDLLEYIGGVPFDIIRPVLERTTCEQLMTLEDYNPHLMEDTNCLWEQHCKRRFRNKSREELETWREMYIRCLDEEQIKFNSLTATIKLSKERQAKPAYVDTNAPRNTKGSVVRAAAVPVSDSKLPMATKSKDSIPVRKRSKKSNIDPDWTPTTWYKTLYKKPRDPKPLKPPKPPIKKSIDMLRYDRAKALEQKKEKWK